MMPAFREAAMRKRLNPAHASSLRMILARRDQVTRFMKDLRRFQ
jgi:hypothetical protein